LLLVDPFLLLAETDQHLFMLVDPFLLLAEIDQHLFMQVHPHVNKDIGIVDSGCSRSMIENKDKLDDFMQVKGGTVTFRGGDEAVSTACYVLNRVSITNPHNKTQYELLSGKIPNIRHLKPFGCQVTILNTSDHLGKFEGKANDDSECDEQVILVPSFPSNSFSGPTVQDVSTPMENNLDYAEELDRLQR
nr:retrovirus-related Pol polyprotein from transposon TNT 1-94 [Tanacetum cinerariifolium]